ncbi:hypothetical protein C8R47DRAFT_188969 [Mycena vitilis]|nr:hypothetical protein C8R47DRAFT_188969 [Mycena vitilis]
MLSTDSSAWGFLGIRGRARCCSHRFQRDRGIPVAPPKPSLVHTLNDLLGSAMSEVDFASGRLSQIPRTMDRAHPLLLSVLVVPHVTAALLHRVPRQRLAHRQLLGFVPRSPARTPKSPIVHTVTDLFAIVRWHDGRGALQTDSTPRLPRRGSGYPHLHRTPHRRSGPACKPKEAARSPPCAFARVQWHDRNGEADFRKPDPVDDDDESLQIRPWRSRLQSRNCCVLSSAPQSYLARNFLRQSVGPSGHARG